MGSYATTTSFSELIPFLFSQNTTTSDPQTTNMLSRHIDRSESMVNSYLTARYSLPFSVVPPECRRLAEDIASFNIIRGSYVRDGQIRNTYQEDYERAIEELEAIRDGKSKLALTDGSVIPTRSTSRYLSNTKTYTPIFNLDGAENWDVDEDQLDDIAEARE